MSSILLRIFLVYNAILVYLVPKKLRAFLLPSWLYPDYPQQKSAPAALSPPVAACPTLSSQVGVARIMDAAELSRVFQMLDQNGDGRITLKELHDSLEKMGIFIADKELDQMIAKIDANGDGCVDVEEFRALYQSIMDGQDEDRDMQEAFSVFDQNSDGFITVDELKAVLGSLGLSQGRTEDDACRMMIKRVDADGDGMVSFNEFRQMMRSGGPAASAALAN